MEQNVDLNQTLPHNIFNKTMNGSDNATAAMGPYVLPDPKHYLIIVNGYVVPMFRMVHISLATKG
jgi:hypothetical protein